MRRLLWCFVLLLLLSIRAWCIGRPLLAPLPAEPDRVLVTARALSVPAGAEAGWQFEALASFPRHPEWPARRLRFLLPGAMAAPQVGETWQYAARIEPPRDARDRRAMLRDHISGHARVIAGPLTQRLAAGDGGLQSLRARLARRIADRIADPAAGALLAALAVGVTGEVSARQWQVFNATGITHLVAISGMHVTFFAMLSMAAARRLWRATAGRVWLPRRETFAAAVGVALAFLYAQLSGFSVPAQRTVVMLAAFLFARERARCARPAWSIAVALVVVLLYDPMAVLGAGFWLSFIAVAAIVVGAGSRVGESPPLQGAAAVQWLVTVALLPVTVAIFGSFSAIGMLANALAIPAFTLLLVPPVLLATACYLLPLEAAGWLGDRLVDCAGLAAELLWPFLSWCAQLPGALWWAKVPWSWYVLAAPLALLVVLPLAMPTRAAVLALLLGVFVLREPRPAAGELWIDVRGNARSQVLLLRTAGHLLLWGTGESFGSGGRGFERQVLPQLRAAGYGRLDLWLPGNLTQDVQAALRIADATLHIEAVQLPPARAAPPEMQTCVRRSWQWDGIEFALDAVSTGRGCSLSVRRGGHEIVLGGPAATAFTTSSPGFTRWRLRADGLQLRRGLLRL
ncbi:MAG: ComEC/Rec2 family competence protein [Steroidobacteraceae bacterium]